MDAKQFIKDYLKTTPYEAPMDVYNLFVKAQGECTYPYFRTLYNNMRKVAERSHNNESNSVVHSGESVGTELPSTSETTTQDIETIVVNYDDDSRIDLMNETIPTGTVLDRLICEAIELEEETTYKYSCQNCAADPVFIKEGESVIESCEECGGIEFDITELEKEFKTIPSGFVRQCCDIVAGLPGSGKSISRVFAAALAVEHARKQNKKIKALFISGEMSEFEWKRELLKLPLLRLVKVAFMEDYVGLPNYEKRLEELISQYDLVVADSFPIFVSHVRMYRNEKRSEKEVILDLINLFRNSAKKYNTNIQLINQANKDGNYKGGTDMPHLLTSMSFVMVEEGRRYIVFRKNRNNGSTINRKLYFTKENGRIVFDEETYSLMYEIEHKDKELEDLIADLKQEQTNNSEI